MKPFTTLAVAVFVMVALLHLARVVLGWAVTINGFAMPMWTSIIGLVVAAALALLVWREHRAY